MLGTLEFKRGFYKRRNTKLIDLESEFFKQFLIINYLNSVVGGFIDAKRASVGSMDSPPITSWGYYNWRDRLYQPDVFDIWAKSMLDVIQSSKHTVCILLTPTAYSQKDAAIFDQLADVFEQSEISTLNMMPDIKTLFDGQLRPRNAWANPADGHPGIAQNLVYAQGAARLISDCERRQS